MEPCTDVDGDHDNSNDDVVPRLLDTKQRDKDGLDDDVDVDGTTIVVVGTIDRVQVMQRWRTMHKDLHCAITFIITSTS